MIETKIPLADEILSEFREVIGDDFDGYRNHVYRMINFCFALGKFAAEDRGKIIIAGCFHDIGIWTGHTFDYLAPSIKSAKDYLAANSLGHLATEIAFI